MLAWMLSACGISFEWPWEGSGPETVSPSDSGHEEDSGGPVADSDDSAHSDSADPGDTSVDSAWLEDCQTTLVVEVGLDGELLTGDLPYVAYNLDMAGNVLSQLSGGSGHTLTVPCGRTRVWLVSARQTSEGQPIVSIGDLEFMQPLVEAVLTDLPAQMRLPMNIFVGEGVADCEYTSERVNYPDLDVNVSISQASIMSLVPYSSNYPAFLYPGSTLTVQGSTMTLVSAGPGEAVIDSQAISGRAFSLSVRESDVLGDMWFSTFSCADRE